MRAIRYPAGWSGAGLGQQRGAVLMLTAGFMLLAVMSLALVIDTGRLFMGKRSLQRLADAAAIEAVSRGGRCDDGSAIQFATQSLARNGFTAAVGQDLALTCGGVTTVNGLRVLADLPPGQVDNAIRVEISETLPASLVAGGMMGRTIALSASAIATDTGTALAALTLRSTLLNVNITQNSRAQLLSSIFGGLLGGSLNISVGAWNGLIHTDIDLFDYLDQLATHLNIEAGNYDEVLSADATTGDLIQAAIDVLEAQNGTPQSTVKALDAIVALDQILVATHVAPVNLHIGDLLDLQTGTPYAGASARLQLFQLVQGVIQLANKGNAVMADVPISVGGATVNVKLKVIEPPQLSAIGDPELARAEAYLPVNDSPNRIYVRSAQVRLLISVSLGSSLTSLAGSLQSTLNSLLSPLTNLLNNMLSLNLNGILGTLICTGCQQTFLDTLILSSPFRFDINIDVGGGDARVTDFECFSGSKALMTATQTAAATLRIGKMGSSAADAATRVFSTTSAPVVDPVALIDMGKKQCTVSCLLGICSTSNCVRTAFAGGGLGLEAEVPVARTTSTLTYEAPLATSLPELNEAPAYQALSSQQLIDSLAATLAGPAIQMYRPAGSGNGLGDLLAGAGTTADAVVLLLQQAVRTVLAPVLDPLVEMLLNNLGIDLAKTEVGANLSCGSSGGVHLVQ